MSLDVVSIRMIGPHIKGAAVLCLGYPEHPEKVDTVRWLREKGAKSVDVVDVIAHFGIERIVDLNVEQVWPRAYDLVINPGTLEHCFNIGMAWTNAWRALAVGGYLMQVVPATMINHGFWNVSPVAIFDWCATNGGEVLETLFATNGKASEWWPAKNPERMKRDRYQLPPEIVMYALCRKTSETPIRWPAQGVYRR